MQLDLQLQFIVFDVAPYVSEIILFAIMHRTICVIFKCQFDQVLIFNMDDTKNYEGVLVEPYQIYSTLSCSFSSSEVRMTILHFNEEGPFKYANILSCQQPFPEVNTYAIELGGSKSANDLKIVFQDRTQYIELCSMLKEVKLSKQAKQIVNDLKAKQFCISAVQSYFEQATAANLCNSNRWLVKHLLTLAEHFQMVSIFNCTATKHILSVLLQGNTQMVNSCLFMNFRSLFEEPRIEELLSTIFKINFIMDHITMESVRKNLEQKVCKELLYDAMYIMVDKQKLSEQITANLLQFKCEWLQFTVELLKLAIIYRIPEQSLFPFAVNLDIESVIKLLSQEVDEQDANCPNFKYVVELVDIYLIKFIGRAHFLILNTEFIDCFLAGLYTSQQKQRIIMQQIFKRTIMHLNQHQKAYQRNALLRLVIVSAKSNITKYLRMLDLVASVLPYINLGQIRFKFDYDVSKILNSQKGQLSVLMIAEHMIDNGCEQFQAHEQLITGLLQLYYKNKIYRKNNLIHAYYIRFIKTFTNLLKDCSQSPDTVVYNRIVKNIKKEFVHLGDQVESVLTQYPTEEYTDDG